MQIPHQIGPYEMLELLGEGGMGSVYRARHQQLKRTVALKVLDPGSPIGAVARQRFQREMQLMTRLSHPAIVKIFDGGESDGIPFIAMELIDGRDFASVLEAGALRWPALLDLGVRMADGIAYLHAQGMLHRDLKPANVLIPREGGVRIADFGLAHLADAEHFTGTGKIVGTPRYMSPEVLAGEAHSEASDLWALGCILYEGLTGRFPVPGDHLSEQMRFLLEDVIKPPSSVVPEIPFAVDRLVMRLLSREPLQRTPAIAVAEEIRKALEVSGQPPEHTAPRPAKRSVGVERATSTRTLSPVKRQAPRASRPVMLMAAAVIALAVLAGVLTRPISQGPFASPSNVVQAAAIKTASPPVPAGLTGLHVRHRALLPQLANPATATKAISQLRRVVPFDLGSRAGSWIHWLELGAWYGAGMRDEALPRSRLAVAGPMKDVQLQTLRSSLHRMWPGLTPARYAAIHGLTTPLEPRVFALVLSLVENNREDAVPWLLLGRACEKEGQGEIARRLYGRALRWLPGAVVTEWDPMLWGLLARALALVRPDRFATEYCDIAAPVSGNRPWSGVADHFARDDRSRALAIFAAATARPSPAPAAIEYRRLLQAARR